MNKEINPSEQWLLSGDCSICRRKKYCSKPCTRTKRADRAKIRRLVAAMMNEVSGGTMKEAINKIGRASCRERV